MKKTFFSFLVILAVWIKFRLVVVGLDVAHEVVDDLLLIDPYIHAKVSG